jgi:hypothetical protein
VRIQFEGWPVIQVSGWPSVAIGTFSGHVIAIDPSAQASGRFRVLVEEDEETGRAPWPDRRFVRFGSKARAWVLLETVPVGYEIWRQLNNFPPNFPVQAIPWWNSGRPVMLKSGACWILLRCRRLWRPSRATCAGGPAAAARGGARRLRDALPVDPQGPGRAPGGAAGRVTESLGAFDVVFAADGFDRMAGFYDGTVPGRQGGQAAAPLGAQLYGEYSLSNGDFPIYEDQYFTNNGRYGQAGRAVQPAARSRYR